MGNSFPVFIGLINFSSAATQGEGQQIVKLAAVNSRPRSSQGNKQSPPVLTITELEQKLRKKVHIVLLTVFVFELWLFQEML